MANYNSKLIEQLANNKILMELIMRDELNRLIEDTQLQIMQIEMSDSKNWLQIVSDTYKDAKCEGDMLFAKAIEVAYERFTGRSSVELNQSPQHHALLREMKTDKTIFENSKQI